MEIEFTCFSSFSHDLFFYPNKGNLTCYKFSYLGDTDVMGYYGDNWSLEGL